MKFNIDCFEVERINFDRDVYMKMNTFSNMGYIFHRRNNTIKADKCYRGYYGHHDKYASIYPFDNLITKNVKRLITKTNYKYSCLEKIVKHHIDILDYLLLYRQFNNIELLVKNKNFNLVREIVKQNIIPEELKVKSNLKYLKYDLTLDEFVNAVYFKEENYEDIKLYANADAKQEVQAVYKYNKNIKKICRYLNDQKEKMSYYKDYIIFADMLGYDLKDKNVLYPSNLIKAHDEAENKVAIFKDKLITKKIAERSKELEKYIFKMNKLVIIPAHSQEELIEESKQLQHCVRRYAERVAKGETNIFFIRKENDENKSYVTLELRNNKVVQCRGYKNNITKPLDEKVKVFVNGWCRKNNFESCFR